MSAHSAADQISDSAHIWVTVEPQSTSSPSWAHQARRPGESCHEFKLSPARVLPDRAICRAKAAGFGDYADCLVEHPYQCPYALNFGSGCLCRHPHQKEIVIRTSTPSS